MHAAIVPPTASPAARATPARPPLTLWLFMGASWLLGWWLAFDGLHQRLLGDYFRVNGQLGPWASLANAAGVDPQRLSLTFIAVGLGLVGASFGVYLQRAWGFRAGLVLSALCLLYLGFGTPVAVACLALLLARPTRAYLAAG